MHFDFAALLVILTFLTGGIWAIDALLFAPRRRSQVATAGGPSGLAEDHEESGKRSEPLVVEYARSFFPVILIVLIIRSFIAEPFRIPSSSMLPTLLVGDLILVSKFSYGLRLPVLNNKFVDLGSPERGDVVVFRYPEDESMDYIKRVIGLPGDEVRIEDNRLIINGEPVPMEWLGPYIPEDGSREAQGLRQGMEYLPGDREHRILRNPEHLRHRLFSGHVWRVPEGQYFVLGDNRDNSRDSRFWGFVPDDHLVGKAVFIWMRLSLSNWGRIGTVIK
ncbi:MAG: signal peptidase I [Xanthomonadales bacterium]|nr:signal peptidase I [Xanthomonadales bacterium]